MDSRRFGTEFHGVFAILTNDLRLLQAQFIRSGKNNAVACGSDFFQRIVDLRIFLSDLPHLTHQSHQLPVVFHLCAAALTDHGVIQIPRRRNTNRCHAFSRLFPCKRDRRDQVRISKTRLDKLMIPQLFDAFPGGSDGLVKLLLQFFLRSKCCDPVRQIELQRTERELLQSQMQDFPDLPFTQGLAADRQAADAVIGGDLCSKCLRPLPFRIRAVQKNNEGFADGFEFGDDALLRHAISIPGQIADAPVRSHHNADGGVILNDKGRPLLSCLGYGDFVVKPGRCHKTLLTVLHLPGCTIHHIAYAVHQADG